MAPIEKQPLLLNNLYYFNVHTRSDDDVVRTFIVRKEILQEVINGIGSEDADSIPQHYMIIGARGMGKSTLLRRLEIEMRTGAMKEYFIPILFPEEQYNIDRLSKFWLNSLDALADTFEEEGDEEETKALDELIEALAAIKDENELSGQAFDALKAVCKRHNRRPVFLIDNIDILFDSISKDQQFKLRKNITTNGTPIFVGASTQSLDDSLNYEAAFYDAFDNIYLGNLSNTEMRELLVQLAHETQKDEAVNEIYSKTAQLDALHSLTGGNPRVAVFMFQLIANGLSDKIFENLNVLLDLITPLYKSNFEQLSKQAQVIVDALALNWDPCDLDKLSEISKLENNQLSSQLDRLMKAGWVERSSRYSQEKKMLMVKNKNYSIRERFFNIWYIMRRASRRQRGDLKSLTCFLETFYTREHLDLEKQRMIELIKENPDAGRVTYGLALAHAHERDNEMNEMERAIYRSLIEREDGDRDGIAKYLNPDEIPPELYNEYIINNKDWIEYFDKLMVIEEYEKAEILIKSVLSRHGYDEGVFVRLGYLYSTVGKLSAAEETFKKALQIDSRVPYFYYALGDLSERYPERLNEAESYYRKAISVDGNYQFARHRLGMLLRREKKYEAAESVLKEALTIDNGFFLNWVALGRLFDEISRNEEAIGAIEKAIELNASVAFVWELYGSVLVKAGKFDEAEKAYEKIVTLDPLNSDSWVALANFLSVYQKKYIESEHAYAKAIELDGSNFYAWSFLSFLLHTKLNQYSDAEHAYEKSLKLDSTMHEVWGAYGLLLSDHLGKHNEAKNAYETAIKLNASDVNSISNLIYLERDKLNNIDEASELFNEYEPLFEGLKDNYYLHQAIFAAYDKNWGIAIKHWLDALGTINDLLPENTKDDWFRAIAVTQKLGFGMDLIHLFLGEGVDHKFRPMYKALEALQVGDKKYLLNVAEEVRKPAEEIYDYMKKYQGNIFLH